VGRGRHSHQMRYNIESSRQTNEVSVGPRPSVSRGGNVSLRSSRLGEPFFREQVVRLDHHGRRLGVRVLFHSPAGSGLGVGPGCAGPGSVFRFRVGPCLFGAAPGAVKRKSPRPTHPGLPIRRAPRHDPAQTEIEASPRIRTGLKTRARRAWQDGMTEGLQADRPVLLTFRILHAVHEFLTRFPAWCSG
jgi:hypothetical protein